MHSSEKARITGYVACSNWDFCTEISVPNHWNYLAPAFQWQLEMVVDLCSSSTILFLFSFFIGEITKVGSFVSFL